MASAIRSAQVDKTTIGVNAFMNDRPHKVDVSRQRSDELANCVSDF